MNRDDPRADAHIEAAIEALARPELPAGHVARVLERTSGGRAGSPNRADAAAFGLQPATWLEPRWVLPVAATMLAAIGAAWQATRPALVLPDVMQTDGSERRSEQRPPWYAPDHIVRPVLPPQAYWGMDAFEEFRTLRPDSVGEDLSHERATTRSRVTAGVVRDDEFARAPVPTSLPEITLSSILPAPLVIDPLRAPAPIMLPAIELEPIVIAPLSDNEERP